MIKRLLLSLTFVTMISAPALAEGRQFDVMYDTPIAGVAGGGAIGLVSSGAVGQVAGIGSVTAAGVGFGYGVFIDIVTRGNDSLLAQGVMGLCSLLGGKQNPQDNYQTCE